MGISIKVDASSAIDMLSSLLGNMPAAIEEGMEKGAVRAKELAQGMAPVRTGRLRASIGADVGGMSITLYAGAPYAKYVELGHAVRGGWKHKTGIVGYVPPHPFLRPAAYAAAPMIAELIADAITQGF